MTDIGYALEKLIDVLQLEGHELFRIFAEVQPALAIQYAIIGTVCLFGLFFGLVIGCKAAIFLDWGDDYDKNLVKGLMSAMGGLVFFLIFLFIGDAITSLYMHFNYPEYYAAKELIQQIGYLTP